MENNKQFYNIFNESLDRVLKGEPVEDCLLHYPDYAVELEPLLRTASAAKAASDIQPHPEFKARARYEFQSALHDMTVKKRSSVSLFNWWRQWQPGLAIALTVAVLCVLGVSTVLAAASSMPDSALYPVKLATENIRLALTFSDLGKAELNANLAEKRVDELVYMAYRGDSQGVELVVQRLNSNVAGIASMVANIDMKESVPTKSDAMPASERYAPPVPSPAPAPAAPDAGLLTAPRYESLPEPANEAHDVPVQPTFRWEIMEDVLSYELQISNSPIFELIVYAEKDLTFNALELRIFLESGETYYWRVRGVNREVNMVTDWVRYSFTTVDISLAEGPVDVKDEIWEPGPGLEYIKRYALTPATGLSGEAEKWAKIREKLAQNALQHYTSLSERLEAAPPEVRPVLREEILKAIAEYETIIRQLDLILSRS